MIHLDTVVTLVPDVPAAELSDWIARGWVAPAGTSPDWVFAEIDVARIRLVRDLRHGMGVEEDSVALVLSLVDQMYGLRRRLRAVMDAVERQPPPVREAVLSAVLPPVN
jgi:chaperone modulatory protein CbpM